MSQSTAGTPVFDAHLHIIDPRFPLVANQGFIPEPFTVDSYLERMRPFKLSGGAVVSGSFQAFDQTYLLQALAELGEGFVGVTQLPDSTNDSELERLHQGGIRAIRFNLRRGTKANAREIERFAKRVHNLLGWHAEFYIDPGALNALYPMLCRLPAVSIDHLGLGLDSLDKLRELASSGTKIKACGFSRLDCPPEALIVPLYSANPESLMFGSDLPSTRAPQPFQDQDLARLVTAVGQDGAHRVLYANAMALYKVATT